MSSSPYKTVAVVGASGAVGASVLPALDKAGFKVTILSRKESKATFPDQFAVKRVDYDNVQEITEALKGIDAVVATLGTFAVDVEKTLIEAAVAAGVKRLIPSEYGVDTANPLVKEINPVLAVKVDITDFLRSKESAGLSWSSLVTGSFFEWGFDTGFQGIDLKKHTATLYDKDNEGVNTFTLVPKIGEAVASILQHPEETKNRHVYISSFALTGSQLIETIEKVSGRKFEVTWESSYDLEKQGRARLAAGDQYGGFDLIKVLLWRKGAGGDYSLRKNDNRLLGLKEDDLEEEIRKLL